jgi:hypothetical protein
MEVTLEQVSAAVAELTKQLGETEQRLKSHVDEAKTDLKHQAHVYKDKLKEEVKKGAKGYGGTLEGIERELADLNKKVDIKFRDHDRVLADHNKRITAREEHR